MPGRAPTTSRMTCRAVEPAVGSAAAVAKSIESGSAATVDSGAAEYSVLRISALCKTEYPVADLEAFNSLSTLGDFAREVLSHGQGKGYRSDLLKITLPGFPIDGVYTRIANSYEYLVI